MKKTILITGFFDENYPRNKALIKALNVNFLIKIKKSFSFFDFLKGLFLLGKDVDYIFVLQPVQKNIFAVFLFKVLNIKKKIIFDAFTSLYDTFVHDRKLVREWSLKGICYYILDFLSCQICDIIVFDTYEHERFFKKTFKIEPDKKSIILPVSIDLEYFDSVKIKPVKGLVKEKINILFYGYYIPLQGVEYIIKSANILKNRLDLNFILIGSGQTSDDVYSLSRNYGLNNIVFLEKVIYSELVSYIKNANICLGIFGNTDKAKRVIPNKVLECMAMRKIVITGKNTEEGKYFEDGKDLIFCEMANEKDLAEKIIYVSENYKKLQFIGENARKKIEKEFCIDKLANTIKENL